MLGEKIGRAGLTEAALRVGEGAGNYGLIGEVLREGADFSVTILTFCPLCAIMKA